MSSLIYRDIELKRQKGAQQFEGRVERFLVKQVRLNGNLKVPGRPGYVYVQQIPEDDAPPPVPVLCLGVQPREGLTGWVERNRDGLWEFVEFSRVIVNLPDYSGQTYLPPHHLDHEWPDQKPGPDAVNVYPRAHVPLRAESGAGGGLTVDVAPLRYPVGATFVFFPGLLGLDLSASQPAVGLARYVGIYLDPATNTIGTVDGTTVVDAAPITPPDPSFPRGCIPSAVVRLDGSQTIFTEPDFSDRRSPLRGDGWKFSGVVRVVGPNSDYASVTLAAAAANAGDIIWVEAGGFTETAIIPAGVHLWGMGQQVTTISSGAATPTLTLGANCSLMNIQVGNSFAGGVAISTSSFAYLYDVYAWVTGGGNPAALQTNADTVRLYNVSLTGKWAISMAGVANTLYIFASVIEGQAAVGTDIHDAVGAGNNVYMRAVPTIGHAVSGVRIDATIAVHGTFVDPNGQLYSRTDGLIQMDERAGAPANPPTNNWDQWFESDGLHILDDAGAEYIFPGGIDPTGHTHSKLVASDGAPDPAFSADATGKATAAVSLAMSMGATIDEFSTDGTLAGNSDIAVPTEKAVKTYVDGFFTAWTDWTPTVDQGGAVAATVTWAKYKVVNGIKFVEVRLTVTGAGSAGSVIKIGGQPAAIQSTTTGIVPGQVIITDTGTAYYVGNIRVQGATEWRFIAHNSGSEMGATPNFALANTDLIEFSAVYS